MLLPDLIDKIRTAHKRDFSADIATTHAGALAAKRLDPAYMKKVKARKAQRRARKIMRLKKK